MYTSPPSLSITCIAMDNVRKILKDRHLNVTGLLTLIHSKHPDCGLPYHSLRRLVFPLFDHGAWVSRANRPVPGRFDVLCTQKLERML